MVSNDDGIPVNWIQTNLGELIKIGKLKYNPNDKEKYPYIGLEHIEKETGRLLGHGLSSEVTSTKSRFNRGDVLYGKLRPYLNKVAIPEFDGVCSTDILVFPQNEQIIPKFLYYRLLSRDFVQFACEHVSGVQHPRTDFKAISKFPLLLPPLAEQQRIVEKIDQFNKSIERGKNSLIDAKKGCEIATQTLFKRTFSGNLFESRARPSTWNWKKLESASTIIMGQSPPGDSYNEIGKGTPLINGPSEFGEGRLAKTMKIKYTTAPTKMCKKGDLIICVRGSTTGRTSISDFDACIGRGVAAIRAKTNQHFLNYYLYSIQSRILDLGTGSTFPNIGKDVLKQLLVPDISAEDQAIIVDVINRSLDSIDMISENINNNIISMDILRNSILNKAFTGKLVPQDPNDEPASVLLDKNDD